LENIRRNQDFLATLGLDSVKPRDFKVLSTSSSSSGASDLKRRRNVAEGDIQILAPTRRSVRVASDGGTRRRPVIDTDIGDDEANSLAIPVVNGDNDAIKDDGDDYTAVYDNSRVLKYAMQQAPTGNNNYNHSMENTLPTGSRIKGLSLISGAPLQCANLPAIYSMQFHLTYRNLLLAAGKGGYISLFNTASSITSTFDNKSTGLLLSFRAHSRWVSTAKFVNLTNSNSSSNDVSTAIGGQDAADPLYVLSASDDAVVKLWDISRTRQNKVSHLSSDSNEQQQQAYGQPKLVAQSSAIHSKGIFCLDETDNGKVTYCSHCNIHAPIQQ
jgi:WD40 repeat protein